MAESSKLLEAFGEKKTIIDWAKDPRCTVHRTTLRDRLKRGIEPEEAITLPPKDSDPILIEAFGEKKSLRAWGKDSRCKVSEKTVKARINKGWKSEEAISTSPKNEPGDTRGILVEIFGEKKTIRAWSQDPRCALGYGGFKKRIQNGMDPQEALVKPPEVDSSPSVMTAFGETKKLSEWVKDDRCNTTLRALRGRLDSGVSPEEALTAPPKKRWDLSEKTAFGEKGTQGELYRKFECPVSYSVFLRRIENGRTLEDALTTPPNPFEISEYEYKGKNWKTPELHNLSECEVDKVTTLRSRLKKGLPVEEALSLPVYSFDSIAEQQLARLISDYCEVERNTRQIITPQELDIYVPSKKFAIEFNGIYWHQEQFVGKTYHYNKFKKCQEKGIRLLQIWEDEYLNNSELVHRMILRKMGESQEEKVFARKTDVQFIFTDEVSKFLEQHHIQGSASGSVHIGLIHEGYLVAAMVLGCIGKDWTLKRYATSCLVPGGFSKCLTLFQRNFDWESIKTFSDNCISAGNLYKKTGFTKDGELRPDYKYVVEGRREHKFKFRLKRFRSDPNLKFSEGATEAELAALNGLPRIYDAGKIRWVMRNPQVSVC